MDLEIADYEAAQQVEQQRIQNMLASIDSDEDALIDEYAPTHIISSSKMSKTECIEEICQGSDSSTRKRLKFSTSSSVSSGVEKTPLKAEKQQSFLPSKNLFNIHKKNLPSSPKQSWLSLQRLPMSGDYISLKSPNDGTGRDYTIFLTRLSIHELKKQTMSDINSLSSRTETLLATPVSTLFQQIRQKEVDALTAYQAQQLGHNLNDGDGIQRFEVDSNAETLWVDKYSPKCFRELLSDPRLNREIFQWVHAWDPVVFHSRPSSAAVEAKKKNEMNANEISSMAFRSPKSTLNDKNNKRKSFLSPQNPAFTRAPDQRADDWRPYPRVLLLCGLPGTGKTTLAHVVATACGYNIVEINASDNRTATKLRDRLRAAIEMKNVLGSKKPNLVVIDEIDGAMSAEQNDAVCELLKIVSADSSTHTSELKRPIICICNDVYARVLRPLRKQALVYRLHPPSNEDLTSRLQAICAIEKLPINRFALMRLCERCNNDMRSTIHCLQLLHSSGRQISLRDIDKLATKELSKDRFSLWRQIFTRSRSKMNRARQSTHIHNEASALVQALSGLSDSTDLLDGVFENYLLLSYSDPSLNNTHTVSDWFSIWDIIDQRILSSQLYILNVYATFVSVAVNLYCGVRDVVKIELPRSSFIAHQHYQRSRSIINELIDSSRHKYTFSQASLDVIPFLPSILSPKVRAVSFHLMTPNELHILHRLVDALLSCGLTYQNNTNSMTATLEPDILQITRFTGLQNNTAALPQIFCERVALEIRLERIRRGLKETNTRKNRRQESSTIIDKKTRRPRTSSEDVNTSSHSAVSSEPRATASSALTMHHSTSMGTEWTECFHRRSLASAPVKVVYSMHFKFHEGTTDAVRRACFVHDFVCR